MKLKGLAVAILLVLGCGAAFGQTYSFGFADANGNVSCDFVTFTVNAPFAVGTHNYTKYCGAPADGVLLGFTGSLSPKVSGGPVTGPVVMMADNSEDAYDQTYSGCQLEFVTRTKASLKRFGWVWYASCGDNTEYIIAWGYLSTQVGNPGSRASFDAGNIAAKKTR
jgi:hypothetical protein